MHVLAIWNSLTMISKRKWILDVNRLVQSPVLVVPTVRRPKILDCPKRNWRLHLRQRSKQVMLAPNSRKPIHPGARLTVKVPMPCHPVSKRNIDIWHRRLGHASAETLRKLGLRKTQTLQVRKKDILRSTTSRASPLRCHATFHRGILGRKILSPFHRRDVKKGF